MEAEVDTFQAARDASADGAGTNAPLVVIEALLTLTAGTSPLRGLAQRQEDGDHTTWRALWLVGDFLAYAEAEKGESDWDLAHRDQGNVDRVTGWTRPLRDISRLTVTSVYDSGREYGTRWRWQAGTAITFTDGATVSLPLFDAGGPPGRYAEAAQAMLVAVRAAWAES